MLIQKIIAVTEDPRLCDSQSNTRSSVKIKFPWLNIVAICRLTLMKLTFFLLMQHFTWIAECVISLVELQYLLFGKNSISTMRGLVATLQLLKSKLHNVYLHLWVACSSYFLNYRYFLFFFFFFYSTAMTTTCSLRYSAHNSRLQIVILHQQSNAVF